MLCVFCFSLRFSEAFLPWLRADPGLPSEPCSSVRQRWKHLRQWVYPVCWEAVSTHSCPSSHTFSMISFSADFHVARVDLIGGEKKSSLFDLGKRKTQTNAFFLLQDNQDWHSNCQGRELLRDNGDDITPRMTNRDLLGTHDPSRSINLI